MLGKRASTYAGKLDEAMVGEHVVVFGYVSWIRPLNKTSAIVGLCDISKTAACIVEANPEEGVSTRMVRFASTMRRGTFIDVEGVVSLPGNRKHLFDTTTQKVEIQVKKLHTIGRRPDGSHLDAASSIGITSASLSIKRKENLERHLCCATGVTKKHTRSRGRARRAHDPYASVYGIVSWGMLGQRPSTYVGKLDEAMVGKHVVIFGYVSWIRPLNKTTTIVGLCGISKTVPCIVEASPEEGVSTRMVRFASTMRRGTFIDIEGVVSFPGNRKHLFDTTTQHVEIQVRKLHTIGRRPDGSYLDAASEYSSSMRSITLEENPMG
ncbi:hypothetical protein ZWY2020_036008 [Hordeum vulgare]|nr:hypothetical protein ZWY2020_036008 [Hordeum vulgare]